MEESNNFMERWDSSDFKHQKESLASKIQSFDIFRKESAQNKETINQSLNEFKQSSDQEYLRRANPLIQNFLKEINQLRKYCNTLENMINQFSQKLAEVPDPIPIIQKNIQLIRQIQDENQKLEKQFHVTQQENKSLYKELKDLQDKVQKQILQDESLVQTFCQYQRKINELEEKLNNFNHTDQFCKEQSEKDQALQREKIQYQQRNLEESSLKIEKQYERIGQLESAICKINNTKISQASKKQKLKNQLQKMQTFIQRRLQCELDFTKKSKNIQIQQQENPEQKLIELQKVIDYQQIELRQKNLQISETYTSYEKEKEELLKENKALQMDVKEQREKLKEFEDLVKDTSPNQQNFKILSQNLQNKLNDQAKYLEKQAQIIVQHNNDNEALKQQNTKLLEDNQLLQQGNKIIELNIEGNLQQNQKDQMMLAIISQRERFKQRNIYLENENQKLQKQAGVFQKEINNLRSNSSNSKKLQYTIASSLKGYKTISIFICYSLILHFLLVLVLSKLSYCYKIPDI